jgi:hypothetical protein
MTRPRHPLRKGGERGLADGPRPVAGLDSRLGPAFFQGENPEKPSLDGGPKALDNSGIR